MRCMAQAAAVGVLLSSALAAQVDVLTAQYENGRTGANMQEQVLTAANVNAAQFGKVFSRSVDGPIYALPLIVTQFAVPAVGTRDLVIVATLANSVYAFDANDPSQSQPYWHVNLGTPQYTGDVFLGPTIGILSTPAIDRSTNTIYLTATMANGDDIGIYIFALDLATGNLKYNSPQRTVLPMADGSQAIDATNWYQRTGLLVANNVVYTGYTYVSDDGLETEHGFVQAFHANDLSVRLASWESSPTTPHGGVWQAGRGLAADPSGNLFVVTADGEWNGTTDFGNSVVELAPATLAVENYFTPANWYPLFIGDTDLGSNGVTLIPNSSLAFTGGKQGIVYLMNRSNLGGLENFVGSVPLQSIQASTGCGYTQCGQNLSTAFWAHATNPWLFVWDKQDYLRAYPFDQNSSRFVTTNPTVGSVLPNSTGGITVTSNASTAGTGILWAYTSDQSPYAALVPGTLRAYDATNIASEIYNSDQTGARDAAGSFVKFLSPVVANGQVYLGTQSDSLQVYGLLRPTPGNLAATAVSGSAINLTWTDSATKATAILVESSTDNVNFTQIASLPGTAVSYSSTGLTTGASSCTEHFYRARAQYTFGISAYSDTQGDWICPVPPAPSKVAVGQSSVNPQSQLTVNWQDNGAYPADRASIAIYRSLDGVTFTKVGSVNTSPWQDTGLAANTHYYYYVQAWNAAGTSAASNTDSTFTAAAINSGNTLVAPSQVAVGQSSVNPQSQLTVNWQDNSNNETGFEIFRSPDGGKTFSQVATVGAGVITWQDTGLTPATAYYYYVEAYNAVGPSAASNTDWTVTASVTTDGGPAPAAPSNVAVGQSSLNPQSALNVNWQDNSNNEQGFQIFRSLDGGLTFAPLATVGPNVITWQDTGLSADTAYYYYVKAYNPAGASAASNTDWTVTANSTVTTGPAPAAPTNVAAGQSSVNPRTQINVYWQDNSSNEAGFQIFRSLDGGLTFTQVGTVAAGVNTYAGVTSYADTGLAPNTDYKYYVQAYNTAGTSAPSNIDGALTAP